MGGDWEGLHRQDVSALAHRGVAYAGPYGHAVVDRLLDELRLDDLTTVLDVGCGAGELLLRVLARCPRATGLGVDTSAKAVATARARARRRQLAQRAAFRHATIAAASLQPAFADFVICVGSTHAFGGTVPAIVGCHDLTRPGGHVLLGEGFWSRRPTAAALRALEADADELTSLGDLERLVADRGLRLVARHVSTPEEWDAYESAWSANLQREAERASEPATAAALRRIVTRRREEYHSGYRSILGFALLLAVREV